jgi:psiF repeat
MAAKARCTCGCGAGAAHSIQTSDRKALFLKTRQCDDLPNAGRWTMQRLAIGVLISVLVVASAAAANMKATAPAKMMPEREQEKMKACEARATAQNVPMDQRSKFVMDCMTEKAR